VTADNRNDVPGTADPELLERSEQLIEEARTASRDALEEDDPAPGTAPGTEYPVAKDMTEATEGS
jgi:hypothetical protein